MTPERFEKSPCPDQIEFEKPVKSRLIEHRRSDGCRFTDCKPRRGEELATWTYPD
jgi:hypothetical protein